MDSRRWSSLTKIIVLATLAILAVTLLVIFRTMIAPTIVALLLAFILSFPVNWIQRSTGWARGTTVAIIYLVLFALLALAPAVAIPRVGNLTQSLQGTVEDLVMSLQSASGGPLLAIGNFRLAPDNLLQQVGDLLQNLLSLATNNPVGIARGVTTGILTFVYVLVLNFWLLKDQQKLRRLIIEQTPSDYQEDMRRLGKELNQIWNQFLRGQLVLAFVVGTMTWILLSIVGMPNAGGLAILAGLMEFLPTIGPGISGAIGTVLALFQGSTWMPVSNVTFALIVMVIYIAITQIESVYLIPRLVGGRVRLHPAVTFVAIINGAIVFGMLGVLLATPTVASARVILTYVYRKLLDIEPFEPAEAVQSSVRIPGLIAGNRIEAVIFDLDGTLIQPDWTAPDWSANNLHWLDRLVGPERRAHLTRRLMVRTEGLVNFVLNQLRRIEQERDLSHIPPALNHLRGHPPVDKMQPLPGIHETMCDLKPRYNLALVTTRARASVDQFLTNSGLGDNMFAVVSTRDDVRNLLPHGEALLATMAALELDAYNILIVSDTDVNLRSARALQMATAGVLSGLGAENDLSDADILLNSVTDLNEWL